MAQLEGEHAEPDRSTCTPITTQGPSTRPDEDRHVVDRVMTVAVRVKGGSRLVQRRPRSARAPPRRSS